MRRRALALLPLLLAASVASADDTRRSGLQFMGPALQALQRDDAQNPAMRGGCRTVNSSGARPQAPAASAAQIAMATHPAAWPAWPPATPPGMPHVAAR